MPRTGLTSGRWAERRTTGKLLMAATAVLLWAALMPAYAEVRNPNGVAVIIGNRSYDHEQVPEVSYAHRDAAAFRQYVVEVLGYDEENIIELLDASQAQLWTVFGSERSHEGTTLWSYLHPRGSDVVVYYSGHGVPGLNDRRGYLLPRDADPNTAEINGYPIDVLYQNLAKLEEARSVAVYLDACFSGGSHEGMLVRSASPVYVAAELPEAAGATVTVLTAASGEQLASWDEEAGHGLFTHHLLDALYGEGDEDGDGQVTAAEVVEFLLTHMTRAARRVHKRRQEATLNGVPGVVLAQAVDGKFPERPELLSEVERRDDDAFASAYSVGTAMAYAAYLDEYPNGRHAGEARQLQREAERAARWQPGERFLDCEGCPEMVVVPAGSYLMGSPSTEAGRFSDEGPQHRVTIGEPFAVGVYEVTFDEWEACVDDGGCGGYRPGDSGWGRGRRPVINVSWADAQAYVRWLSRETEKEYRLLSESEWEYVARAGTSTAFHYGRTISTTQANYNGNYTYGNGRKGEFRARTVEVGTFSSNAYGLHDVHGNVWEWVEDCWNESYRGAPSDGRAWERGECARRVVRGGSWDFEPRYLRSAFRLRDESGDRDYINGFRVARTLSS